MILMVGQHSIVATRHHRHLMHVINGINSNVAILLTDFRRQYILSSFIYPIYHYSSPTIGVAIYQIIISVYRRPGFHQ